MVHVSLGFQETTGVLSQTEQSDEYPSPVSLVAKNPVEQILPPCIQCLSP